MSQPIDAISPDLGRRVIQQESSPAWPVWLCIGLTGLAVLTYLFLVLSGPTMRGWDTYLSFSHLYVWTAELKAHELLSTWTPLDANGYGSPLPFFYHKLFNLVGAALTIASGDIVTGYRLTILVFSAVLFGGVYLCARRLGASTLSSLVMAAVSLFAPYYMLKIGIGTIADFSGATLIPLVLAPVIEAFKGRFGVKDAAALFAMLVLVMLAHVLVAAMTFGVVVPVVIYLSLVARRSHLALIATALAALVYVGLFYVPFSFWSARFSPAQAFIGGGVENHLSSLRDVLSYSPLSPVGWPFLALMACMAFCVFRGDRRGDSRVRIAFVLGCLSVLLVLMTTWIARPFWALGGPLEFIQFPFRLMSVATPLCLVAIAGLLAQFPPRTRSYAQAALLVVALVMGARTSNIFLHAKSPYAPATPTISYAELNRDVPPRQVIGPDAGGEYLPASYRQALAGIDVFKTPVSAILPAPGPFIEAQGCRFPVMAHPATLHVLQLPVSCAADGTLRINQFSSPMLESVATNGAATVYPSQASPFIEFALPAGQWTITVKQRNWLDLAAQAWRARLAALFG
ncbi:6-pyruvoyl-tetrahydropterin synthase-related protein [Paraburkholderia sp. J67]|uniref:6-pyruvoyl-tetrahydropterin synthase-related protein n=1 Tax=Paraburkholderia sp. J67 TaxID=2805435 RepID=UPI002ABD1FDC|nr:6-pyruvoyl-tetrahydropterin synthase-related protein [Paraburkholderia sp. J67]